MNDKPIFIPERLVFTIEQLQLIIKGMKDSYRVLHGVEYK